MRPSPIRPSSLRRALLVAVLALALSAAPAFAGIAPTEAHSPNADDIRTAYWVMLVVVMVLSVAGVGALAAAVSRFREKAGAAEPSQAIAGRGAIVRVAVPLGLAALAIFIFGIVMAESATKVEPSGTDGLSALGTRTAQVGVEDVPTGDAAPLEINVVGQQWLWRFEYPSEREDIATVFSYNELVVPVDTAVILSIDSTDVLHRWFVPALGGQVEAVPGEISQTWFKADEAGVYPGRSTLYSGTSYPAMRSWVRVVSAGEYEAYQDELAADLTEAQEAVQDEVEAEASAPTAEEGE